jgi:hypothetical protein
MFNYICSTAFKLIFYYCFYVVMIILLQVMLHYFFFIVIIFSIYKTLSYKDEVFILIIITIKSFKYNIIDC